MVLRRCLILLAGLLLGACAGGPPPDPIVVTLSELTAQEKQRLYDGRYSNPPMLDVNREVPDLAEKWDSDDLTWIETDAGWHARLRFVSPDARGLRIGLCIDPANVPVTVSIDESDGRLSVPASEIGSACEKRSMFFFPLVAGEQATLRFSSEPSPVPRDFDVFIRRVQHRGN